MFDIAFGLFFAHILSYVAMFFFIVFVALPVFMNIAFQDGYRANCGRVWRFLKGAFQLAFGKAS